MPMSQNLQAAKALIFRITHVQNVPWILENGLHCANGVCDPGFVPIGDGQIIARRRAVQVPVQPYGDLSDYVPFYFTPFSPMMLNIRTGYRGVIRRSNEEIAILVSSLHRVSACGAEFVFTDRHALAAAAMARFSSDLADLEEYVPWPLLQARDFQRDPEWPEKVERYQAEALVHRHLPAEALLGIICYTDNVAAILRRSVADCGLETQIHVKQGWYF